MATSKIGLWLLLASVLIGCSGVQSGSSSLPAPATTASLSPAPATAAAKATVGASAVPSQAAVATPSAFTSAIYHYSVGVPGGWGSIAAIAVWDGTSGLKSDSPEVDRWVSRRSASAWASAAAYAKDLKSYAAKTINDTVRFHGDTCPDAPEAQEAISVGGEPGTLMSWDCGILINLAVTVHDGIGYTFGFRDPDVHAAMDADDHAVFVGLLESVRFPG